MLSRLTGRKFATRRITKRTEAASTNNDLWIVPSHLDGQVAQRTSLPTIPPATPRRSIRPMARYIAYRAQQRPGYESDRFRLMLYDRKTGEKKNLTPKS